MPWVCKILRRKPDSVFSPFEIGVRENKGWSLRRQWPPGVCLKSKRISVDIDNTLNILIILVFENRINIKVISS